MRSSNRRGSILLETGLALPVFGLLLMGGVDFGRLMVAQQALVSATFAGAQPVLLHPQNFTDQQVTSAIEKDNPGVAKQVRLERFNQGTRRYLRITVESRASGLFGIPSRTLSSQAVVRLP